MSYPNAMQARYPIQEDFSLVLSARSSVSIWFPNRPTKAALPHQGWKGFVCNIAA